MKYINIIFLILLSLFLVFGSGCVDAVEEPAVRNEVEENNYVYEIPDKFVEGDFIITTDEFYNERDTRFYGKVLNSAEFHTNFEVCEYDILNILKEDGNATFRKFLFDEFGIKENKDEKSFLFKDITVHKGMVNRDYMLYKHVDEVAIVIWYSFDDGYSGHLWAPNEYNTYEPFKVVNETEFMNKYEVIEYDK